jgi:hypothetical protein
MPSCFSCKKEIEIGDRVGRAETCPHCGADLHCCLNCGFYDPKAYNECREPQAERVLEKDRSNFCDYFQMAPRTDAAVDKAAEAKRKLEELFKKK